MDHKGAIQVEKILSLRASIRLRVKNFNSKLLWRANLKLRKKHIRIQILLIFDIAAVVRCETVTIFI